MSDFLERDADEFERFREEAKEIKRLERPGKTGDISVKMMRAS
ncbi:hypothetical protein [Paraburkholderia antibiotica]|nr:hypothetical protein [Paraburkholderia antibiotica]